MVLKIENRLVCTEHYDFLVLCRQEIYSAAYLTSELCAALAMWVRRSLKLCYGAMCGCKIWFLAVLAAVIWFLVNTDVIFLFFYWIVWGVSGTREFWCLCQLLQHCTTASSP